MKHILALCRRFENNLCVIYTFVKLAFDAAALCVLVKLCRQFIQRQRHEYQRKRTKEKFKCVKINDRTIVAQ